MSHIVEEFAKHCGVKISKPEVCDHFFPIVFDKYIVLSRSCTPSTTYSYWSDVLEIAKPILHKNGFKVLQINKKQGGPVQNVDMMLEGISYPQMSYLIQKSHAVIGESSVLTQIASVYDKPTVSLHAKYFSKNDSPYWGSKSSTIEPDRELLKPSFSEEERPKSIDTISPEEIVKKLLASLNIEANITHKSLHIGNSYTNIVNELCPNFFNPAVMHPETPLNIRLDWHHDPIIATKWMQGRRSNIFIDQPIKLDPWVPLKQNINQINFFVSSLSELKYIKYLQSFGVPVQLITKDKANLESIRLKFIDFIVEEYSFPSKKDLDNLDDICENSFYKSSKNIYSNNSIYPSKAAMIQGIPYQKENRIIDNDTFWEELENYYIYNK